MIFCIFTHKSWLKITNFFIIYSLKNLRSLRFDGCHLRSIPTRAFWGLSNLVSLTVVTRNAGVLAIEAGAFAGLDSLEKLDLSGNYIRHLAPGVLCSLPKLTVLNLSKNEIGSLSDLGLLEVSFFLLYFYFVLSKDQHWKFVKH